MSLAGVLLKRTALYVETTGLKKIWSSTVVVGAATLSISAVNATLHTLKEISECALLVAIVPRSGALVATQLKTLLLICAMRAWSLQHPAHIAIGRSKLVLLRGGPVEMIALDR